MMFKFNHHASIIRSTLETPESRHPFSCVFFQLRDVAIVETLVVNSVLSLVLFYKVKVVWLT